MTGGGHQRPEPLPTVLPSDLPWLSVAEMRAIDTFMVEQLGVELEQMMENAGRNLAEIVRHLLGGSTIGSRVVVLVGPGGNGGGGLVAARHLRGAGADVQVILGSNRLAPVTRAQLSIVERLDVRVANPPSAIDDAEIVVDALLGYSQDGAPRGAVADLITATRSMRVISLDVPSGLELETGEHRSPSVRPVATMTLAAPKQGLERRSGRGDLYLADIGVPREAFLQIGRDYTAPFGRGPLIRVTDR